jgi:hypothetical protein
LLLYLTHRPPLYNPETNPLYRKSKEEKLTSKSDSQPETLKLTLLSKALAHDSLKMWNESSENLFK